VKVAVGGARVGVGGGVVAVGLGALTSVVGGTTIVMTIGVSLGLEELGRLQASVTTRRNDSRGKIIFFMEKPPVGGKNV